MEQGRILMIEDDAAIREGVRVLLEGDGFRVDEAETGILGLEKLKDATDLVILDIMMPGMSGIQTCGEIRKKSKVPVLFLTAKGQEADKLLGFTVGGDDYLVKPFAFQELMARIRCVTRRPRKLLHHEQLSLGNITYRLADNTLTGPLCTCSVSGREGNLLEAFLRSPGQTLSRTLLLTKVWGMDSDVEEGNLDNYIHFLRRRLKTVGSSVRIRTVRGVGYCIE